MIERRKAWEQRTGYAAKKRDQQRQRRERQRAAEQAERAEKERAAIEERNRRDTGRTERRRMAIERAAAAGDPFARMQLHSVKCAEYWKAYRDYEMDYAAQTGKICKTEVNGIPVTYMDFPETVATSIQEIGKIIVKVNP